MSQIFERALQVFKGSFSVRHGHALSMHVRKWRSATNIFVQLIHMHLTMNLDLTSVPYSVLE